MMIHISYSFGLIFLRCLSITPKVNLTLRLWVFMLKGVSAHTLLREMLYSPESLSRVCQTTVLVG